MPEQTIAEIIIEKLSVPLGPNVAKMAIKSFAKKSGASGPEKLTIADVPKIVDEIRPMLNVMIGKAPTEAMLTDISRLGPA
jgi:hypothetical protein